MSHHPEHHKHAVKGSEVFVGGLPQTTTESKIREVFSHCGDIVEIRLIKDQKGCVKGFCFVRFATKEAADKALKEKNGIVLDGKKIGVLPSTEQNTLYLGNLNKGWSAVEFEGIVRQVFPDVVSVDLAMPLSSGGPGHKQRNRGFAFVKFSSHAAAARAHRVGSKPDFTLGGKLHPTVQWAEEETDVDPTVLAKIKIAFIRNLPTSTDENYLKKLFEPFGMIEKVVLWKRGSSSVGFVHFRERSDLDNAIKEMNEKMVQGPNGGPTYKLVVEVARPMEKSKKRSREDSESKVPDKIPNHLPEIRPDVYSSGPVSLGLMSFAQKEVYDDPYEAAILALPENIKKRLLQILRLGIATRFDIDIQSLNSLKELPESTAISVLDQFMLSGGDSRDKRSYLAGLISRHQVDKMEVSRFAGSLSRVADIGKRDSGLYSFLNRVDVDSTLPSFTTRVSLPAVDSVASPSGLPLPSYTTRVGLPAIDSVASPSGLPFTSFTTRVKLPAVDSVAPSSGFPFSRPGGYISRYSGLIPDSTLSNQEPLGRTREMKERGSSPLPSTSTSSIPYERLNLSPVKFRRSQPQLRSDASPQMGASIESRPARPQMRFDPFTGQPYKFDPFTGEPIIPDDLPRRS